MKKILVFSIIILFTVQVFAQDRAPNGDFTINYKPVSGLFPNSVREPNYPVYYKTVLTINQLDLSANLYHVYNCQLRIYPEAFTQANNYTVGPIKVTLTKYKLDGDGNVLYAVSSGKSTISSIFYWHYSPNFSIKKNVQMLPIMVPTPVK
ncbi:MAG: hypothetical protein MI739_14330 [Bacteroidales bacterium]|nr:hypothetical protein [Bacteroidales bacterium]